MKKTIIVLSGNPSAKTKFDAIAKTACYVWNANAKNYLANVARDRLYWEGDRDEKFSKLISELFRLLNEGLSFEQHYILDTVKRFQQDDDQVKVLRLNDGEQKTFENFVLVLHGVTKELVQVLQSDFAALQIHVIDRSTETNFRNHDLVLYEDDDDFESQVYRVLGVVTQSVA